jgi:hypothetical protein
MDASRLRHDLLRCLQRRHVRLHWLGRRVARVPLAPAKVGQGRVRDRARQLSAVRRPVLITAFSASLVLAQRGRALRAHGSQAAHRAHLPAPWPSASAHAHRAWLVCLDRALLRRGRDRVRARHRRSVSWFARAWRRRSHPAVPIFSYLIGIAAALFASWYTYGLAGFFWLHDTYHLYGGMAAIRRRPVGTFLAVATIILGLFICVAGTYVSVKVRALVRLRAHAVELKSCAADCRSVS